MTDTTTDLAKTQPGTELDNRRLQGGLAEGNGVIDPARWQMLAAIAETIYKTPFVPVGLRDNQASTLACLLYGDALGLQPMTSLKEIHVIDGTPGLSAAAMGALVRKAHPGHRLRREELRDADGRFIGVKANAVRGDTEETDEYTFTLEMAARAGLTGKHNWKSYPEAMCTARAYSQLCTFLFPDVFMGSPYMPEELEGLEPQAAPGTEDLEEGHVVVKPPENGDAPQPPAAEEVESHETEQTEWEVALEDGTSVAYIDGDDRRIIAGADTPFVRFPDDENKYEVVGYEVDGATSVEKLVVRVVVDPNAASKPAAGSIEAVGNETIPKVFEHVTKAREAGNIGFIKGVLDYERANKNRGRLVTTLEEIVSTMEADAVQKVVEGDGTGDDNPLLEPEADGSAEDGANGFTPEADESTNNDLEAAAHKADLLAEVDPEIPYTSATKRAKVARLAALCAYMEDQHPQSKAWHLSGVIGAASKQFGVNAHALDDFAEEDLEKIWKAAEQHASEAVQFLALMPVADLVKLANGPTS